MRPFKDKIEERMRDSLRAELDWRRVPYSHTQNCDVDIQLPRGARAVVEIKKGPIYTSGSYSVYAALGQLFFHTRASIRKRC